MRYINRKEAKILITFLITSIFLIIISNAFFSTFQQNAVVQEIIKLPYFKDILIVTLSMFIIYPIIKKQQSIAENTNTPSSSINFNADMVERSLSALQNEQNLLAIINNTEDLLWSVDTDFKYFVFNESYRKNYAKLFGEEVFVGKCALNEKQGKNTCKNGKACTHGPYKENDTC